MASGATPEAARMQRDPVTMKSYSLYNPAGSYGSYVMPGLILVIIQQTLLVGIGMIGGARREKQKLLASSKNHEVSAIFYTLTGRSLAYFFLYSFNLIFTQIILYQWFGFPDKGSMLDLWLLMVPFLFSVIFMGLTVSLLLTRREHSIMMLVFLSPVVFFCKRHVMAGHLPSTFTLQDRAYFPVDLHDPCLSADQNNGRNACRCKPRTAVPVRTDDCLWCIGDAELQDIPAST